MDSVQPPSSRPSREQDLLRAARTGDSAAFAALVEESSPSLERLALRLVHHRQDAEDVAQDAIVTAWRKLDSFRGSAPFRTWICRILVRRALDLLRGRKSIAVVEEVAAAERSPAAHAAGLEIEQRVHAAIDALPPVQRATMLLRVEQNLTYEEIAYVLGSSRNAVRMNLIDARKALAKRLREVVDMEGDAS